ncbi:MAG: hypothetical protein A2428_00410 [Bdellovibrionales bacterium RIFOXYC1_FULL_54_43]|nr:MAG: hypothetical protein A2428_00410 [Bdellovibrionales bacterium RIFOXYC1_FULL_54_43]OFZ84909.1 MAG: hypothetical protein A2603_10650 [Bdellovibrionales bacterium RIFOXYD1_FULL_55_31]
MNLQFEREKYLEIVRIKGYSAALTALHHDLNKWEWQTFEGPEGFLPEMWTDLEKIREFSIELWDMQLRDPKAPL